MDIINLLAQLGYGDAASELNAALQDLAAECQATGKKGGVDLSIDIEPKNQHQAEISYRVKTRHPNPERQRTIVYMTKDGFSRRDPRQGEMFRDVSGASEASDEAGKEEPVG